MKRITFGGSALMTGSAVADEFLTFAQETVRQGRAVAVDIPVLEADGRVVTHSLLIGPSVALDVVDADEGSAPDEAARFPVPGFVTHATGALPLRPEQAPDLNWDETTEFLA